MTVRSKSLSHFLDGPVPWPKIQLNRHCTCLEDGDAWCECSAFPYQLLYVSKAIANEVSAIFYSENYFTVFRNSLGGLSVLGSLSHKALSQMTSLSIYINIVEEDEREWIFDCHVMCSVSKMSTAFRKERHWDETHSIKEWQRLCKILRPNIKPNRLKLFLACDMADIELSDEFLQPLLETPTLQLRECSIRLASGFLKPGNTNYHTPGSLQELVALARLKAQQAADQLTTNRLTQSSFRYGDLPKEIRLQILEHTELVSPFDLAWTSNPPVNLDYQPHKSQFYEHRTFHYGTYGPAACCQKCSPRTDACTCFLECGAFSTTCTCWTMPVQFFLVNKQMKDDAEFVFYSNNHFLVSCRTTRDHKNIGIYDFLTHLPGNGRRYLRSLSLDRVWGQDV